MRRNIHRDQPDIFDSRPPIIWPNAEFFPHNNPVAGQTVDGVLGQDLRASACPFMVTGYTSLDRVLDLLTNLEAAHRADLVAQQEARIVIGHEPSRAQRKDFRDGRHRFEQDIADYWLRRGISIARSAYVLNAIECLQRGSIQVRTSGERVIHAKIYVTETAATLGSSNYSVSGMRTQAEANCRFLADRDPDRYEQTRELGEAIWQEARDYKAGLLRLLEKLLLKVDWRDALGRACAELLEGRWTEKSILRTDLAPSLWPSQRAGIAQALWILDNTGSVLVADATGSGKTRMGAQLLSAIKARRVRTGALRPDSVVLICPPAVEPDWRKESIACGLNVERHSHGVLSNRSANARADTIEAVRRASVLAVDEAHHYHNRATARTQVLYRNMADHVVLFTATPINRGTQDLLAIVDLLGADNFDDEVLRTVERAWRRRGMRNPLSMPEQEKIRAAIQRFTIRRTKTMLNALVEDDPERYRGKDGNICRYPEHKPLPYPCSGTSEDRRLAERIRGEASNLRGLSLIQKSLRLPPLLKAEGVTPKQYLERRLKGASHLAMYRVSSTLRSSRAALREHLRGTEHARRVAEIESHIKGENTGNVIRRLAEIAGRPPKSYLDVELPAFLSTPEGHSEACKEEIATYERIEALLGEMTSDREDSKAALLARRLQRHERVLAFDTYLITLHDLKKRLKDQYGIDPLLATGESKTERMSLRKAFHRESTETAVGLCSDALSEGVNLQGASAVVLLDMPSVIRVAEQRIGRIDRMDSPYPEIEVFWPDDSPEFAIRSNELFLTRVRQVADLIGSNIQLPPALQTKLGPDVIVGPEQMKRLLDLCRENPADEIQDAFYPVRSIIHGDQALVPASIYESVRGTAVRVRTAVSVVNAEDRWGFYAIRGDDHSSPRWVYIDSNTPPVSDLAIVAAKLRERLGPNTSDRNLDRAAAQVMEEDLAIVQNQEEQLLPRRKQRALDLFRIVQASYRKNIDEADVKRKRVLRELQRILSRAQPPARPDVSGSEEPADDVIDLEVVADWWIERIRPVWQLHLADPKRKGPARLKDIKNHLITAPISTADLESLFHVGPALWTQPAANRVVAAIVGIPLLNGPLSEAYAEAIS